MKCTILTSSLIQLCLLKEEKNIVWKELSEVLEASTDSIKWTEVLSECENIHTEEDQDIVHGVMSPEEIFEEAFGELDQLDAAMLQLAPRKLILNS